jgi:hypothetical protein
MNRRPAISRVWVTGIWTKESGGMRSSADPAVNSWLRSRSQLVR